MTSLVELIRQADRIAAFTGAGVSTLSGVPDFRGPQGLYKRIDADRIFSLAEFQADPSFFYTSAADFLYCAQEPEPSLVHQVCARLEQAGCLAGVITQNIDMLHRKAGSRRVIELHGSPERHHCLACGWSAAYAEVAPLVHRGELPRCRECAAVLKPGITFFGEMLPAGALEEAVALAASADLMLVLGSSLVVQPAASVPVATARRGGSLAIVNLGATPLDDLACYRSDDLEREFRKIQDWLDSGQP